MKQVGVEEVIALRMLLQDQDAGPGDICLRYALDTVVTKFADGLDGVGAEGKEADKDDSQVSDFNKWVDVNLIY